MTARHTNARRGAAMLLAVIVLVASATLAATGMLIEGTSRDLSLKTDALVSASRAHARGLVSAIQAELDTKLDDLIAGDRPDLGDATSLINAQGSRRWAARVIRTGSRLDDDAVLRSESGKLNLNAMPEAVLRQFSPMPADAVDAIIKGRPFASVRDAVAAAGATMDAAWVPLVTVFSSDPPRSSGLALDPGADRDLLASDSQDPPTLPEWVAATGFDPFSAKQRAVSIAELYHQCTDSGLSPEQAGRMLDLVTFSGKPAVGLLDVNTAPAECLAALPGFTAALAEDLVDTRARLSVAELSPLTWPVREGLLTPEQLETVLPLITTRSLQWGVRIEAGLAVGQDDDPAAAALEYPVRYALVIDTAGSASRVIMLRDETNASAAVPPPLQPVADDSPVSLLQKRAAANPRPTSTRPARTNGRNRGASKTPGTTGASSPPGAPESVGASQVRRDRTGGSP